MNGYERMMAALNREIPDTVPIFEILGDHLKDQVCPNGTLLDMYDIIDVDGLWVCEDPIGWETVSPVLKRDHFGVLRDFRLKEGAAFPFPYEPLIAHDADLNKFLESYTLPDPLEEGRFDTLKAMVKRFKGKKAIVFAVWSSFIYPSFLRGFENLLMDFFDNPDFVAEINDRFSRYYEKQIYRAAEIGADCIMESEDFCGKTGPFFSVDHFKNFCLPGLKIVREAAAKAGLKFIKHSDGYVWPLMEFFADDLYSDAYHPSEPIAGMRIEEVKQKYGKKLCVIGNIDCSHLLPFGTEEEIDTAVRECMEKNKEGGGYILSSSNCIHAAVPYKNLQVMIHAGRKYGKY
jgi:uroporphyrinogen decarboxylase